ncbi:MAG: YggS family pyridoxal phosphate-dependent enzyme [Bdellovibrionota bacterium]
MVQTIKENIEKIQNKIKRKDITLVAVSKYQSIESIEEAYACGLRDFGENYIQEWQTKCTQLSHLKDIRWHIIGHLQKNKAKFINENVYCLQSLDSIVFAKELEKKYLSLSKKLNVLVQLQVDKNDAHKSGVSRENFSELCSYIKKSNKLNLIGFMGIGPNTNDVQKLKQLYNEFTQNCYYEWNSTQNKPVMSLGMSQDLEVALECGSNMVRVGTAIFGERHVSY